MRKLLLSLLMLPLLFACGDIPDPQEAEATTILGNPDPMSVACATGYRRVAPHICSLTDYNGQTDQVATFGACETKDFTTVFYPVPTTASQIILGINANVVSLNAIGLRSVTFTSYSSTTCTPATTQTYLFTHAIREEVAVVANTNLLNISSQITLPLQLGKLYIVSSRSGATGNIALRAIGYYD